MNTQTYEIPNRM